MDFTQFDSRTAAETPARLHLVNPANGEPIFADADRTKPCIALVVGTEGRAAQAALRAVQKAKMTGDKRDENDRSIENLHAELVASATPLVRGFENVMRGDRPAKAEDAEWLFNLQLINGQDGEKSFVEQVMTFATKRANFLGKRIKALTLCARQWGYLHSTPKTWSRNRLQQLQWEREPLGLPDLDAGDYMVEALFVAGPVIQTAMGECPIDWPAAYAFGRATGMISEPWEYRALIDMSAAYMAAREAGKEPLAIPPTEQG